MRKLTKLEIPNVLAMNYEPWTRDFVENPDNATYRFRYRHQEIKTTLLNETHSKCIYCESKIGHNTPGDTEHKKPTFYNHELHFDWNNLTIACTECNRRKGEYYNEEIPFLDPYIDEVDERVIHHGPLVAWTAGDVPAEVSIRQIEMHDGSRGQLLSRKIEKIVEVDEIVGRLTKDLDPTMKALLQRRLIGMQDISAEYSAMVIAVCRMARIIMQVPDAT